MPFGVSPPADNPAARISGTLAAIAPGTELPLGTSMDWNEIFGLTVPPLELVARGTVMYLFLFTMFRVVIKRRIGAVGMADLLVLVIIADAAQNGMAGEYRNVTEGIILVATIIAWEVLI